MKSKKLTKKDFERMWGDDGPYSQVRLSEEIRILDDAVSRVFLVVELEINPFSFEWAEENRDKFTQDIPLLQLLDYAENRGDFGYVASAGEIKLDGEKSREIAREQVLMATQTVIRLHEAVIKAFNLQRKETTYSSSPINQKPLNSALVWNDTLSTVEHIPLADTQTSSIPLPGNRYTCVLTYDTGFTFDKKSVKRFAAALDAAAADFGIKIVDCESFAKHMVLTVIVDTATPPKDFVELLLRNCNHSQKEPLFQKDFSITRDNNRN